MLENLKNKGKSNRVIETYEELDCALTHVLAGDDDVEVEFVSKEDFEKEVANADYAIVTEMRHVRVASIASFQELINLQSSFQSQIS